MIAMGDEEPTRCAQDGKRYTMAEFCEQYGWRVGEARWKEAGQRDEFASASSAVPKSTPQTSLAAPCAPCPPSGQMSPSSASEHDKKIAALQRLGSSPQGPLAELAHESVPRTSMEPPAPVQASPPVAPSPRAACAGTVGGELPRTSTAPLASIEAPPPVALVGATVAATGIEASASTENPWRHRAEAAADGARAGAAEHDELGSRRILLHDVEAAEKREREVFTIEPNSWLMDRRLDDA